VAALAFLAPVAPAAADGLPLPVEDSPSGVRAPDGASRYLSVALAGRTAVLAQQAAGGAITSRADLRGHFTIPLVAYDSSAGGISGDGRTLVLIRPRRSFPRRETTFAVMSVRPRLRLRRIVRLPGDFSYDALSPDGTSLFLINYTAPRDPTTYRVRVYDLARRRLDPRPVVDPRESPDDMSGLPVTRAVSRGGRWAYTLYSRQGPDSRPFIHALDTRDRRAVCIDLDGSAFVGNDAYALRLAVAAGGARLDIRRKGELVATVDTTTFRVRAAPAAPAARPVAPAGDGSGPPWPALLVILVLGAVLLRIAVRWARWEHPVRFSWHRRPPSGSRRHRPPPPSSPTSSTDGSPSRASASTRPPGRSAAATSSASTPTAPTRGS
jgi:hypothetical protein